MPRFVLLHAEAVAKLGRRDVPAHREPCYTPVFTRRFLPPATQTTPTPPVAAGRQSLTLPFLRLHDEIGDGAGLAFVVQVVLLANGVEAIRRRLDAHHLRQKATSTRVRPGVSARKLEVQGGPAPANTTTMEPPCSHHAAHHATAATKPTSGCLHVGLCCGQCCRWCSAEQYHVTVHLAHFFVAGSTHTEHTPPTTAAAAGRAAGVTEAASSAIFVFAKFAIFGFSLIF